ncbi:hypothetical protein ACFY2M_40695 [Streptomyces sp. NPDC001276]|uniref:hypothetical protein n=1 Tax=Streptomyces sp. NPDC001276 TaxID=3364555 RepID=UPI00369F4443
MYGLFRRWQRQGVWARLLTLLQARADEAGLIMWEVNVNSTICRAHQHAAGARRDDAGQKEAPGGVAIEPDDHGLGRSRGGFTTKPHLACEQGQRPLSLLVTAGHRHDSPQFQPVLEAIRVPRTGPGQPRSRPDKVRADPDVSPGPCRAHHPISRPWPHDSTSSQFGTKRRFTSRRSTSDCEPSGGQAAVPCWPPALRAAHAWGGPVAADYGRSRSAVRYGAA